MIAATARQNAVNAVSATESPVKPPVTLSYTVPKRLTCSASMLTSLPALSFTSMYVVPGRRGRMGICSMPRLSRGVPASTMSGTSAERRRSSGAIPAG